jgi:hypothetical protein
MKKDWYFILIDKLMKPGCLCATYSILMPICCATQNGVAQFQQFFTYQF